MIYLWMFLALCIVCVSGYIGQVLNVVSAVSSFFGMVILAALIYYFTMWLTGVKWHTEFCHLNRGDMLTSEQHRGSNEKKKF